MTDINRDKINQFVQGLRFDQKNKSKEESAQQEAPSEPAPQPPRANTALDPDLVLRNMGTNAASIQQALSVQSSLAGFEPFLKTIDDAFRMEFSNFDTLSEETRRNLVLKAANVLMDKGVV